MQDRPAALSPPAAVPITLPGIALVLALALAGSALLTLSAKLQVPFWPVPMTMQPAAVLLIGLAFGPRLGAATVLLYLAEGMAGLPVFAGTPPQVAGPAYLLGPTGGYLVGHVIAAAIAGQARGLTPIRQAVVLLGAMVALYACGLAWLATFVGPAKAIGAGALPFLLGDGVKLLLVFCLWRAAERFLPGSAGRP